MPPQQEWTRGHAAPPPRRSNPAKATTVPTADDRPSPVYLRQTGRPTPSVLRAPDLVRLQRSLGNATVCTIVAQRTPADFKRGYDEEYLAEFRPGLTAGLTELSKRGVIDRGTAAAIVATHQWQVEYPVGWHQSYQNEGRLADYEDGQVAGRGAGYDQGYEDALTLFGYSRRYGAIPLLNKNTALLDNAGTCVYCNARPNADVDHIMPLKVHWRTKGATMGDFARSSEANNLLNLVGACATCNRSKGAKILVAEWQPPGWQAGQWWPFGPARVSNDNSPPPYW